MNLLIFNLLLFFFFFFFSLLSTSHSCHLLTQAFSSITNFQLPTTTTTTTTNCTQIQELNLSSKNLTGTVSWMLLKNISTLRSIDLSHNSLQGSIPGAFWSSPSPHLLHLNLAFNCLGGPLHFQPTTTTTTTLPLQYLNLSNNRFTNAVGAISSFAKLRSLDLSHNNLTFVPPGLHNLHHLDCLDVSYNSMTGVFPEDFPITDTLEFLNVSFNNLTGKVNSTMAKRFGNSSFISPGHSLSFAYSSSLAEKEHKQQHRPSKRVHHKLVVIGVTTSIVVVVVVGVVCGALWCVVMKRRRRKKKKGTWKEEERRVKEEGEEEVSRWVGEARWGAALVVFEKPLMELTFSDLAAATSGFSKEWQLGSYDHDKKESRRSGELYRAVLAAGEMQVVVRVMESVRGVEEKEAEAGFRELAKLRHPNLLPLLGYCIPGREKLVLYEYMKKGDLHQWLHELPAGSPDTDDWTGDTLWEPHQSIDNKTTTMPTTTRDWPTRHKIALGIARGLAFLHQGWAGTRQAIVHGHLVPSNILLDDNLEPRIADFATGSGEETTESNVYRYGLLVMELVTGKGKWTSEEVDKVRKSVKEGKGLEEVVDFRMQVRDGSEGKWEREMVECLRVGYLCTAQSSEKRPTMQQVVGLIKDIRPPPTASIASSSTYSGNS